VTDTLRSLRERIEQRYRERTPGSAVRHQRAERVLPGGDTRGSTYFRPYPLYLARGEGGRVWDVDDNVYIDAHLNHTSLMHGHAHPHIVDAIRRQAELGSAFGAPTEGIIALAEALVARVPSMERVRFANSGTEAVMHAVRAARAFTGRPKILKMDGAYHGSYDAIEVSVEPVGPAPAFPAGRVESPGLSDSVAAETLVAPYNDAAFAADLIERHARDLAAVIVEPMMGRNGVTATPEFMRALREATSRHGVVLIFDEVQTFRIAYGGGQSLYDVKPDLTALGKVIGGGFPVGAFGGRLDIMRRYVPGSPEHLHQSGTFNGNAMTMAAGLAALELLTEDAVASLNALGERLRDRLRSALDRLDVVGTVTGAGSYAWVHFSAPPVRDARSAEGHPEVAAPLHLLLLNHGIFAFAGPRFVLSTVTAETDVDRMAAVFEAAVEELAPALRGALAGSAG
jgi:glutamate-1-semialdehyde 2,1-aminomutase